MKRILVVLLAAVAVAATASPAQADPVPAAGTQLWLRNGYGMTQSGGKFSSWTDQSGTGRHATMTVASRQPQYVKAQIGFRPVVRFNGAQSLYLAASLNPVQYTVLVVGKNGVGGVGTILGPGGSNPNNQLQWAGSMGVTTVRTPGTPQILTAQFVGDNRVYHRLTMTFDGSTQRLYRNGTLVSTQSASSTAPWLMTSVGSFYSSSFLVGDIAEIMVYPRVLSASELADTEGYLSAKFGL